MTNTMMAMVRSPSFSPAPQRPRTVSDFDMSRMPVIHKRTLHPWSVHRSLTTGKYIATLVRKQENAASSSQTSKVKHVQFPFRGEREARKFCKAYSPPKLVVADTVPACMLCQARFSHTQQQQSSAQQRRHCRNCGIVLCDRCTHRWGLRMVPKTYVPQAAMTVRVCKSCDWLSNAFCMALLQGRYQDALQLYDTVSHFSSND